MIEASTGAPRGDSGVPFKFASEARDRLLARESWFKKPATLLAGRRSLAFAVSCALGSREKLTHLALGIGRRSVSSMPKYMKTTLKCAWLTFPLLLVSQIVAQDQSSASDVPAFAAQGAFFAIVVTDLDASVPWYQANLGLHLIKRGKSPRLPAETAVMGGHNLFVELIYHDGKPLPRIDNEDSVPRLIKAGVILGKKDFDSVEAYLQRHGTQAGM